MPLTRRRFLLTSTAGITAFAGCSTLSDTQRSLLIAVNNYTASPRQGHLRIEDDGTELVRQYLEVGTAGPETFATVETEVTLQGVSNGTSLDVTASFGDGLEASGSVTLNCTAEYAGDAIYVQVERGSNLRLNDACYDQFPSGEARQGGINAS